MRCSGSSEMRCDWLRWVELVQRRELLEHREQRLRAVLAVACGLRGGEELMNEAGCGERRVRLLGGLHEQAQVLLDQVDHEAGAEIVLHHLWPEVRQLPARRRAAADG